MTEEKQATPQEKKGDDNKKDVKAPANTGGVKLAEKGEKPAAQKKSVYANKNIKKRKRNFSKAPRQDEFEQRIVDLARVTRVMAGGKRMRFRACVALGNKKGKIGVGIDKGADVTIAVTKAVNQAKKNLVEVPIINDTIPHEMFHKKGAAKIILKPAGKGKGVIAGGTVRIILELAGIKNVTSKILGTNNKVNNAKCTIDALANLKKVEMPKKEAQTELKKITKDKEDKKQ